MDLILSLNVWFCLEYVKSKALLLACWTNTCDCYTVRSCIQQYINHRVVYSICEAIETFFEKIMKCFGKMQLMNGFRDFCKHDCSEACTLYCFNTLKKCLFEVFLNSICAVKHKCNIRCFTTITKFKALQMNFALISLRVS